MESKVAKITANHRLLSISLLGNSVAIKRVLQQQILASTVLSGRRLAVNDLPDNAEITLETIPVHRLSRDRGILYRCAIALKLAPLWQLSAFDIAHQLANSITKINTANAELWEAREAQRENSSSQIQNYQQTLTSKRFPPTDAIAPSQPLSSNATPQASLDFSLEILFPGWIHFQLSDRGLATWLQQLIQMPPLLSDLEPDLSIGFQKKGDAGERESKTKNEEFEDDKISHQKQLTEDPKIARQLFAVQYAHARCCSLLRLAHREGSIELSDSDFKTQSWHFVEPSPIPWLYDDQEMTGEPRRLRLGHAAERGLIEQILDGVDRISDPTSTHPLKLATLLSHAFKQFYGTCRIWGEVKTETPKLARARLGLVGVTQKVLRSLLEEQLGVSAPIEL
jgi:hypothetical protein